MIEINLLPGSTKKATRRGTTTRRAAGPAVPRPKLPEFDRGKGLILAAWVLGLGFLAYLHLTTSSRLNALTAEREAAVRDSARYAALQSKGDSMRAQEAVISQKMQVIQEIDAGRYIWAHVMDELSRALPSYVWLIDMNETFQEGGIPRFRLEGRAGNYFALGRYIEDLENSPFIHGVRLISSQQTTVDERTVLGFILEAQYQEPPPDAIQTVPLFTATQPENR